MIICHLNHGPASLLPTYPLRILPSTFKCTLKRKAFKVHEPLIHPLMQDVAPPLFFRPDAKLLQCLVVRCIRNRTRGSSPELCRVQRFQLCINYLAWITSALGRVSFKDSSPSTQLFGCIICHTAGHIMRSTAPQVELVGTGSPFLQRNTGNNETHHWTSSDLFRYEKSLTRRCYVNLVESWTSGKSIFLSYEAFLIEIITIELNNITSSHLHSCIWQCTAGKYVCKPIVDKMTVQMQHR